MRTGLPYYFMMESREEGEPEKGRDSKGGRERLRAVSWGGKIENGKFSQGFLARGWGGRNQGGHIISGKAIGLFGPVCYDLEGSEEHLSWHAL